jgi:hypothetical protein
VPSLKGAPRIMPARYALLACRPGPVAAAEFIQESSALIFLANDCETKKAAFVADNPFMHKQDIKTIVDAASETADTIVGARRWRTAEEASAMHDVIFWDMIAKQLPDVSIAELLSILD